MTLDMVPDRGRDSGPEDIVLRDGTPIEVRSIASDDAERLLAFHDRLSPESRRLRFFTPHPHLLPSEVRRFVNVDGVTRVALVAIRGGAIVGVARFDRIADTADAEAALVVQDDLQGLGLGTALLERLAIRARPEGIKRLIAQTLPENTRMLHLFRKLRSDATTRFAGSTVEVTVPIGSKVAPRGVIACGRAAD